MHQDLIGSYDEELEMEIDDRSFEAADSEDGMQLARAVRRRYQVQATLPERDNSKRAYRFAGWELNLRTRRLTAPGGEVLELSNGEFSLLAAFCGAPQRVLSRDQLLSLSRLHEAEVYDRTIDVQILRLRRRIEAEPAKPRFIVTQRGAGYLFDVPVETVY